MRKVKISFAACMIAMLLLSSCGTAQTGTEPLSTPEITEALVATKAPEVTAPMEDAEEITETPIVTEAPTVTEAPKVTQTPKATEVPMATEVPIATATLKPTATPTATSSLPKADTTKGDICYTADELKALILWDVECTPESKVSAELKFTKQYSQIRLALPEAIDSKECTGISIKMKSDDTWLGVMFYGEGFIEQPNNDATESFLEFIEIKEVREEHGIVIPDIDDVYGIGFMYTGDVKKTGIYTAVLESITFHMLSGNEVNVTKKMAPDVTEDMTLRNTYGKEFGYIGTCVSLAELRNPAILKLLKEQYNSVTSGAEVKLDRLMVSPAVPLPVEAAKKLGYVIPENYKEEVVPRLNFDVLDETLEICAKNGLSYRFHTLMWHLQCLDWFFREGFTESGAYVSPKMMDARMEFYIRTVMEHVYNSEYGHVVYAWDVMNEHLHADKENSSWERVYGEPKLAPEFLKSAYSIADDVLRKHGIRDKVALVFNEYDTYLVWNGRDMMKDIISVLDYINSDGMVCDTVGMQSHLGTDIPISGRQKKTIEAFLDAGYGVQFTEAEVNIKDSKTGKEDQERYYCEFMKVLLELAQEGGKITGVTFWGHGDTISGLKEYTPLMFTHIGRPKDVYYKVLQTYADPDYIKIEKPVELTYRCDELQQYVTSGGTEYTVNDDGSMDIAFQGQYNQVRFLFPKAIDMSECEYITVKAKSEYSDVAIMVYGEALTQDDWCDDLYCLWDGYGEGTLNYAIYPTVEDKVHGIGFMALDEVEDDSKYKATVYSVTFHMKSKSTATPNPTETPKATATPKPTAKPKPTAVPTKAPDKNGELTFAFSEMKYLAHFGCSYESGTDDVLKMSFDKQYAQLFFVLPQSVDLSNCEYITIKAKSEYGALSAKLLDKRVHTDMWNSEIYARYDCIGDGVAEYELCPEMTSEICGVALMSSDEVEDFSKYKAEVYSITFYMKGEEEETGKVKEQTMWGDVTYDFHDMKYVNSYGTTYKVEADGSLDVSFDGCWKEVRFAFPEAVDMNYCYGITVEADADAEISVKFFDKKLSKLPNCNEVFTLWNCNKEGVYKYAVFPEKLTELYGIGFVSSKEGVSYEDYKATVKSVTFHMASGTEWKVPKDIAPDVTADMNFKNTYATVFEHFGATLSLQELRHPRVLSLFKEQYTSLSTQCDFKPNFIFRWDHEFISVEEAKKQGYIIPKNYKEKTVPVLHFEYVDEILTICGENGIDMRGHTLLWHGETATWFFREGYSFESAFVSPEVMDARLEFYIRNVMSHVYNHKYGHVVYSWDVVNEYYHSDSTNSDWLRVYGEQGLTPEFVRLAYEVADDVLREFGIRDKVSLIFNDFNTYIEYEGIPDALISLVKFINSDGKICDGIGMQAHLDTYWPEDRSLFIKAAQKFLDAGLEVQITEMDISIKEPSPTSEEDQRKAFERVFRDLLEVKKNGGNITVVNIWGIGDHNSWLPFCTPLMFKNYDVPKDAYYAVLQAYLDAGFKVK